MVFTDINLVGGDPDDRQSLVHLLWYANELDIVSVVPDRWNGPGRNEIYEDPRFDSMWWVESNWTYNGMFVEPGPGKMFEKLSTYGAMGMHIKEATAEHPWAQYFRVGDTPSVLYLIDASHDPDDPASSSWAGQYKKPFPDTRPHYYTDDNGDIDWDYAEPCNTWQNLEEMYAYNKSTLLAERPAMYDSLLKKLDELYAR